MTKKTIKVSPLSRASESSDVARGVVTFDAIRKLLATPWIRIVILCVIFVACVELVSSNWIGWSYWTNSLFLEDIELSEDQSFYLDPSLAEPWNKVSRYF